MRYSVLTWLYLNNSYNINPDINSEYSSIRNNIKNSGCEKMRKYSFFHSPKDLNCISIVYESFYVKATQYAFLNIISDATPPS